MQTDGIARSFWNGRRVFVTGHTGFLGGWLCAWLNALGAETAGFALAPPTRPSFFESAGIGDVVHSVIGDIRDAPALTREVCRFDPEIVIHLAAQPLVRRAHADPIETFSTNVMGTANLLQALRDAPSVTAAVIMTTDKVYENQEWLWGYREEDRLGGREPYGCSKACAEHVVDAFRMSYFADARPRTGIATVRAGNVIGGGDWAEDRLVPDSIRAFNAGETLHIRNPDAIRPWQHVLDPINGILMLAERLSADPDDWQGAWNLGPAEGDFHPVSEVADAMVRLWGDGARWTGGAGNGGAPYEARLLTLNPSKAAIKLGWRRRWPFERALAATVEWYKAHAAGANLHDLSWRQIAAFEGAN